MRTLKALSFTVLGVATAALAFTAGRPAPPDTHPDQPRTDAQQIGETWNARIAQMDDLLHSSQALADRARELDRTLAPMARRDAGELDRNVDLLEQMSESVAAMAQNLNETGQRYESMLRDPGVRTAPGVAEDLDFLREHAVSLASDMDRTLQAMESFRADLQVPQPVEGKPVN